MKTYSRLTLSFLLLILIACAACNKESEQRIGDGPRSSTRASAILGADEPPENGKHVTYYENGQKAREAHYKNGKDDGLWTAWDKNGQKTTEGHHKDGKREGLWITWHLNGQKGGEFHYKDGKQDGLWTVWYENGQKRSDSQRQDGKLVSISVWKPDGKPCPETKIVNGSGISVSYHDNGKKWIEAHYKNDKLEGLLTWWDKDGNKTKEVQHKDGKVVSRKKF